MKAPTTAAASPAAPMADWPPEVAALGTPERIYTSSSTLEAVGWVATFTLFAITALFAVAIVKPFGQHPPPAGVAFAGFLVCGLGSLALLMGVVHLRGYSVLVFPSALMEMRANHSVIVPWTQIARLESLPGSLWPRYLVVRQVGRNLEINGLLQEIESLRNHIEQHLSAAGTAGGAVDAASSAANPGNTNPAAPGFAQAHATAPGSPATPGKNTGFLPPITDMESARKVARQGTVGAALCAAVTTGAVILSAAGVPIPNINANALVDAFMFAVIAFGISRLSRLAAGAGLTLYLVERLATWNSLGFAPSVVYLFIFTMMFVNGVRGTFAFHRFKDAAGPGNAPFDPLDPHFLMTQPAVASSGPTTVGIAPPMPPLPDPHAATFGATPGAAASPPSHAPNQAAPGYAAQGYEVPQEYSPFDPNLPIYNPQLRQSSTSYSGLPSSTPTRSPLASPLVLVLVAVYLGAMLFYAIFSHWMTQRYAAPANAQFQRVQATLNVAR